MQTLTNQTFDQERALYHLQDALVSSCRFEGPADGESALKETRRIRVEDCFFALRYPLWHCLNFTIKNSEMTDTCRAALWYDADGGIYDSVFGGIKALRECDRMTLTRCRVDSSEFGWNCRVVEFEDCDVRSEYFLLGSRDISCYNLTLNGKYSFQYVENVTIENSNLNTKDAFWHAKNVTVRDSVITGEYLGWYSDGLTLINCRLAGTQPLCYCKNLTLIDCTMDGADFAFECSDVSATVRGHVISIKNPRAGSITVDSLGELITEDPVYPVECRVTVMSGTKNG